MDISQDEQLYNDLERLLHQIDEVRTIHSDSIPGNIAFFLKAGRNHICDAMSLASKRILKRMAGEG